MLAKMLGRGGAQDNSLVKPGREGEVERIRVLEAQIQELAATAAKAVDRAESLEQELEESKKQRSRQGSRDDSMGIPMSASENSLFSQRFRRDSMSTDISSALSSYDGDHGKLQELEKQLAIERKLRTDAEARELALSSQIEDLSVSLFEDANKRVADQSKRMADQTKQVEELQQTLHDYETSDPTSARLRKLEVAVKAIHHARSVLNSVNTFKYV